MSKASNQLDKIIGRLKKTVKESMSNESMVEVGKFSIGLIVKRTRLGYGVNKNLGDRSKLKPLSAKYIEQRKKSRLNQFTKPSRSNLTRTGQMLDSLSFKVTGPGKITIEPTGNRDDGKRNKDIAKYNAQRGRVFINLSKNEYSQIVRFYRKTFGDLLRLRKLIK